MRIVRCLTPGRRHSRSSATSDPSTQLPADETSPTVDLTLARPIAEVFDAISYYYDIEAWAARTNNCRGTDSMACMACSMPVLESFELAGIAPIGVSNDWWFLPERSATCGMCMRVYMHGDGQGTHPLESTVSEPWAYSAKIYDDPVAGAPYFIAVVVEWFDRYQSSGLDITYPIYQMRDQIGGFGTWSVGLEPVPCPVDSGLTLNFMDYSKPYPVSGSATNGSVWQSSESAGVLPEDISLCDNRYDVICGSIVHDPNRNPVSWPKLKVWGSRFPVGDLRLVVDGQEYSMRRSPDDFWEPEGANPGLGLDSLVTVRIQCLDSDVASTVEATIRAGDCLCQYQDPGCEPCQTGIQC